MIDAYEVAYKLKAVDQFSSVLGLLTTHLVNANTHAETLQHRLGNISSMFKTGALVTGAGFGMAMTLKAATNEAVKYEQQMNRLKALNLGTGATASLTAQAQAISKITAGTSQLEALRMITETQAITGDTKHTGELAPVLAQMRFGMESYMAAGGHGEGHGGKAEKQFADIIKVMEMRGLMRDFSEEKLTRMSDLFVKNYVASGGMVKPSDFLNMMKTGGVAGKTVNEDFMFAMGHIMQEKGGNRAGTQLMSTYQNLVAGRSTQQVAENLLHLGLLNASGVHYGTTGHITKTDFGALKSAEVMQQNPLEYLNTYILPALAKKGIDINDSKKVLPALTQMASNRNAADFLSQLYLERGQIANYMDQAKNAMGYKALYAQGKESTVGQTLDLQAKINQLELELGQAALPLLKAALEQAIPLVKQLGDWLGKHPDGLKTLVYSIAGLSVAMMVSGPIMMLASGVRLLGLVAGMGGAAGASGAVVGVTRALVALGPAALALGAAVFAVTDAVRAIRTGDSASYEFLREHGVVALRDKLWGVDDAAAHDKEWAEKFAKEHPTVRPGGAGTVQVKAELHVDGKKMAETVSKHQARNMSTGMSGGGFDNGLALAMPGAHR